MALTDNFRKQHDELLGLVSQIEQELDSQKLGADANPVRQLLSILSGKVKIHLALEDQTLYPSLRDCLDPETQTLALQFQVEMGGLLEAFTRFVEKWPNHHCIRMAPLPFIKDAQRMADALSNRIQRENEILYVAAEREIKQ
jgi:hemerythrin-like domain-containing protein